MLLYNIHDLSSYSNWHIWYDGTYNIGAFYDSKGDSKSKWDGEFCLVTTGTLYLLLLRTPCGGVPIAVFFY